MYNFPHWFLTYGLHVKYLTTCYEDLQMLMSDIKYQTKVYTDIPHNVGLCALQSDIGRSDIRLSPISLITDIGLSAHLCWQVRNSDLP